MGGGVMRTAAKVAGIGTVMHGGLRGSPAVPSSGKSVRTASVPVAAGMASQSVKGPDAGAIEKPWVEAATTVDDWQMVGDEGEMVMSAGEPMPRVVFGAAPSYKEAKEATDELKEALDKVYLSSPKATELGEQTAAGKVSGLSLFLNPESEAESVLATRTSVPQHAYQAFELLSRSTEAQNVVASIASDPNIWNAMMENSAVKQFMESQKTLNRVQYESVSDSEVFHSVPCKEVKEEDDTSQSFDLELLFNGFVDKVKLTVNTIVSNLSTYIQNIFEPPAEDNGTTRNVLTTGFMGLAVMVVMVVLLKRA
ncbi:uncharacterized protein LOC126789129 [Argentina anserina]|uniref:uncharacterized protein LOC126789129 n=1 Tax=Argentina anserina TaxID=57926 RepID=UPI0021767FCF|nr:uncharacterized protein LOC126789129 [Potentilla anserina]